MTWVSSSPSSSDDFFYFHSLPSFPDQDKNLQGDKRDFQDHDKGF